MSNALTWPFIMITNFSRVQFRLVVVSLAFFRARSQQNVSEGPHDPLQATGDNARAAIQDHPDLLMSPNPGTSLSAPRPTTRYEANLSRVAGIDAAPLRGTPPNHLAQTSRIGAATNHQSKCVVVLVPRIHVSMQIRSG